MSEPTHDPAVSDDDLELAAGGAGEAGRFAERETEAGRYAERDLEDGQTTE